MLDKKINEYIELLEDNLRLMEERQDLMQKVQNNYGTHKAGVFLKNIKLLSNQIDENNKKLKRIKEEQ